MLAHSPAGDGILFGGWLSALANASASGEDGAMRAWGLTVLAAGAALGLLSACGAPSQPSATSQNAPANAVATPAETTAPPLPSMPKPDHDDRPDRAKLTDFLGRIESQQASLAAADATFLRGVRVGIQNDTEPGATVALAAYRGELARELAALPPPPRLSGCFARASGADDAAASGASSMLTDRRDKLVAATSHDGPLTLADFGPLATDIAGAAQGDAIKASTAAARSATAGCSDVAKPRVGRLATRSAAGEPPLSASPTSPAVGETAPPAVSPTTPAQPPHKPGLFDRFKRVFQ
jgi:hypothetical protein